MGLYRNYCYSTTRQNRRVLAGLPISGLPDGHIVAAYIASSFTKIASDLRICYDEAILSPGQETKRRLRSSSPACSTSPCSSRPPSESSSLPAVADNRAGRVKAVSGAKRLVYVRFRAAIGNRDVSGNLGPMRAVQRGCVLQASCKCCTCVFSRLPSTARASRRFVGRICRPTTARAPLVRGL